MRLETPHVIVADKPAGQPTAPLRPGETGTIANALVGRYPEIAGVGYGAREPGVVHRLDTDTSGLLAVARTAEAFEIMKAALKDIQSGKFAKDWVKEYQGGYKQYNALLKADENHSIEKVGAKLRSMMPWMQKRNIKGAQAAY